MNGILIPLHCIEYTRAGRQPDHRKFQRVFSRGWARPSGHSAYARAKYQDTVGFWEYRFGDTEDRGKMREFDTWIVNLSFSSN